MAKSRNPSKSTLDNRSGQLNPQRPEYYRSRGDEPAQAQERAEDARQAGRGTDKPSSK